MLQWSSFPPLSKANLTLFLWTLIYNLFSFLSLYTGSLLSAFKNTKCTSIFKIEKFQHLWLYMPYWLACSLSLFHQIIQKTCSLFQVSHIPIQDILTKIKLFFPRQRDYGQPIDLWLGKLCHGWDVNLQLHHAREHIADSQLALPSQLSGPITSEVWPNMDKYELFEKLEGQPDLPTDDQLEPQPDHYQSDSIQAHLLIVRPGLH